jgi:hypothetical protein
VHGMPSNLMDSTNFKYVWLDPETNSGTGE